MNPIQQLHERVRNELAETHSQMDQPSEENGYWCLVVKDRSGNQVFAYWGAEFRKFALDWTDFSNPAHEDFGYMHGEPQGELEVPDTDLDAAISYLRYKLLTIHAHQSTQK